MGMDEYYGLARNISYPFSGKMSNISRSVQRFADKLSTLPFAIQSHNVGYSHFRGPYSDRDQRYHKIKISVWMKLEDAENARMSLGGCGVLFERADKNIFPSTATKLFKT